nr:hypothetical protein [Staphylococcus saprophyticus]
MEDEVDLGVDDKLFGEVVEKYEFVVEKIEFRVEVEIYWVVVV